MSSLPVPVSPEMNTVESVGATLAIRDSAVFNVFGGTDNFLEHRERGRPRRAAPGFPDRADP